MNYSTFRRIVVFQIFLTFHFGSAHGQLSDYNPDWFCKEFVSQDGTGKKPTFKETLKLFRSLFIQAYRPSKMVDVGNLNDPTALRKPSSGEKAIFVLLPNPTLSDEESKKVRDTLDLWKKVKKLELVRKMQLEFNLDQQSCIRMIAEFPEDFKVIQAFHDTESNSKTAIAKKLDANAYAGVDESLKKYVKDGWKIIKTKNYTEVLNTLQSNNKITEIMFVLHSVTDASSGKQDNTGLLYDASSNILPAEFFFALPNAIEKVLIMTCHSNEVIQYYRINEAGKGFDFYYAVPSKRFEKQLNGSFPQSARYAFMKASKASTTVRKEPNKNCLLEVESQKSDHAAYVNMLTQARNQFIGVLNGKSSRIAFDCSLLPSQNIKFTAAYIGSPGIPKSSLEITAMKITDSTGKITPLTVTENFKVNRPEEHYETVGRAPKLN